MSWEFYRITCKVPFNYFMILKPTFIPLLDFLALVSRSIIFSHIVLSFLLILNSSCLVHLFFCWSIFHSISYALVAILWCCHLEKSQGNLINMNNVLWRINCKHPLNPAYTLYNFCIWGSEFFFRVLTLFFMCMESFLMAQIEFTYLYVITLSL